MLFLYMLVNFADYVEETLTYYRLPAGAPQAHEIGQHAGAVEPGDQTQHTLVRIFPIQAAKLFNASGPPQTYWWQNTVVARPS
jgi:hypothetical protein